MTPATKRSPRKADLARLAKLLAEWEREEATLAARGFPVWHGSMRQVRLKDAAALQAVLAYFDQP